MNMGRYFGTDGFRGKAGVVLTAEHAFKTGRYLGWYYGKKHLDDKARIVIGKDTRRSSYCGYYFFRGGCLSAACYYDSVRQLYYKN